MSNPWHPAIEVPVRCAMTPIPRRSRTVQPNPGWPKGDSVFWLKLRHVSWIGQSFWSDTVRPAKGGSTVLEIILIVVSVAIVGVPTWLYFRRSAEPVRIETRQSGTPAATGRSPARSVQTASPFRAVSVRIGSDSCGAARLLSDNRFLGNEAPGLPLAECDVDQCQCRYEHHADRRDVAGRRFPYTRLGGMGGDALGEERRSTRDRREE